jgi:hypothetical protein
MQMSDKVPLGKCRPANRIVRGLTLSLGLATAAFSATIGAVQAAVNISSGPTKNMSCTAGVCTPTAKDATLNADHLAHLLKASDMTVLTGNGAVTIVVTSALTWANASRLTLDADYNVSIKAPVTVAGPGALTIVTNDGGSGGDLLFFPGGKIDFWDLGSSLVINGVGYTLVGDIADLADDITTDPAGAFALAGDYNASADGTYSAPPIQSAFQGRFEGLGHAISNLTIATKQGRYVGLFAVINPSGIVRDIALAQAAVTSQRDGRAVGALVGVNAGTVSGASSDGSVSALVFATSVGGLIGGNDGLIANSSSNATVTGYVAGGLVGWSSGTILRCHASGAVSDGIDGPAGPLSKLRHAGGLAGVAARIIESYATGSVTVSDTTYRETFAGGLVGEEYSSIENSYALGAVRGGAGGRIGGLIGRNDSGTIATSYSTGLVSGSGSDDIAGGLVGSNERSGAFSDDYWDIDTSGLDIACGHFPDRCLDASGLTDAQLKSGLPAGFDPAIWGQDPSINNGYPYLLANPPAN